MPDPLRNFGFLVRDVARLSSKNFERHAAAVKLGLTLAQCKVLFHLERNQSITQARLAELTDTDPMTLVRILDRMERDGWVERRADANDRRVRRLHLGAAARPVVRRIRDLADRSRAEVLGDLSAGDRAQLLALLERVHDNLLALVPDGAAPRRARRAAA